jgi:hypothetical protein
MSKAIKNAAKKSEMRFLKLWAFLLAGLMGLIASCCQNPIRVYYGPVQPLYGIQQAPAQSTDADNG